MRLYGTQQDALSYDTNELFPGIVALDHSFVLIGENLMNGVIVGRGGQTIEDLEAKGQSNS